MQYKYMFLSKPIYSHIYIWKKYVYLILYNGECKWNDIHFPEGIANIVSLNVRPQVAKTFLIDAKVSGQWAYSTGEFPIVIFGHAPFGFVHA